MGPFAAAARPQPLPGGGHSSPVRFSWEPVRIWLTARLVDDEGIEHVDEAGDTLVKVARGLRLYSRPLTIGIEIPVGDYSVIGDLVHGESPYSDDAQRLPGGLNEMGLTVEPKYVPWWVAQNPFYVPSKEE